MKKLFLILMLISSEGWTMNNCSVNSEFHKNCVQYSQYAAWGFKNWYVKCCNQDDSYEAFLKINGKNKLYDK